MDNRPETVTRLQKFGGEQIEVTYRKVANPEEPGSRAVSLVDEYFSAAGPAKLNPGLTMLKKGQAFIENGILLPCDIIWERDVAVKLRDGFTIYVDILRPVDGTNLPAIISWSPYGKKLPQTAPPGVSNTVLSGLAKFEGPDPAYWCRHGYAIINVDPRGIFFSEGDIAFWGTREANDAFDTIEWTAANEWSNGKVGMSGNSWLAIIQWFTAPLHPPHLAAIAPWEGHIDLYRHDVVRGGIPDTAFCKHISSSFWGKGYVEDMAAMGNRYRLLNGYWKDKCAHLEEIDVPAYVVASYSAHHTLEGFHLIGSKDKWLRVHNTQEWFDYYVAENLEDLRRFFDRYLKGVENGWEKTPRVRLSVLNPGGKDIINRPEKSWPLPRTRYQSFYLDASTGSLSPEIVKAESSTRYQSDDGRGQATFTIKFNKDTELTGFISLHLWVEAQGADDMDLFVLVQKLDASGQPLTTAYDFVGVDGRLRVSHRLLDKKRSIPGFPYHPHDSEELLKPGQIVPVDIAIRPIGMLWQAGQQLRLTVAGFDPLRKFQIRRSVMSPPVTRNKGVHIIHTGGKYDSHLVVPLVPKQ